MSYRATITKDEIAQLPVLSYSGKVVVVEHEEELDKALAPLFDCRVIGFDTETRPAFQKGVTYPVSLLQLATEEYVLLIRLNRLSITPRLKSLLQDTKIKKVGVGIRDDLRALKRLSNFRPASFIDIQSVVQEYGIEERSFAKLMAIVFGVHVSKRQRVTNWAADKLSEAQISYAATDAWGALMLYLKLTQANDFCVSNL